MEKWNWQNMPFRRDNDGEALFGSIPPICALAYFNILL